MKFQVYELEAEIISYCATGSFPSVNQTAKKIKKRTLDV